MNDPYTPTPCPRCGQPTTTYYDDRNTWEACARCRVRSWVGSGYGHATGHNPPPPDAKPAPPDLYSWEQSEPPAQ